MGCTASTAGVAQTTPKLHRRTQPDVASHRNEDNAAIVSKGALPSPIILHHYNEEMLNVPQTQSSLLRSIKASKPSKPIPSDALQLPEQENPEHAEILSWKAPDADAVSDPEDGGSCETKSPTLSETISPSERRSRLRGNKLLEHVILSEDLVATTESHHLQEFFAESNKEGDDHLSELAEAEENLSNAGVLNELISNASQISS